MVWRPWPGFVARIATVPAVLFVIVGVLYLVFRSWCGVALIFLNIPVVVSGGLLALFAKRP